MISSKERGKIFCFLLIQIKKDDHLVTLLLFIKIPIKLFTLPPRNLHPERCSVLMKNLCPGWPGRR